MAEAHPEEPVSAVAHEEREKAAGTIQRTYRGYRTRRQLDGFGLDASTRWVEVRGRPAFLCKSQFI